MVRMHHTTCALKQSEFHGEVENPTVQVHLWRHGTEHLETTDPISPAQVEIGVYSPELVVQVKEHSVLRLIDFVFEMVVEVFERTEADAVVIPTFTLRIGCESDETKRHGDVAQVRTRFRNRIATSCLNFVRFLTGQLSLLHCCL